MCEQTPLGELSWGALMLVLFGATFHHARFDAVGAVTDTVTRDGGQQQRDGFAGWIRQQAFGAECLEGLQGAFEAEFARKHPVASRGLGQGVRKGDAALFLK